MAKIIEHVCDCGCGASVNFRIPFIGADLEVHGMRCFLAIAEKYAAPYIERRGPEQGKVIPIEESKKFAQKSNIKFTK